jgi:hypothetical protein
VRLPTGEQNAWKMKRNAQKMTVLQQLDAIGYP